MDPILVHFVYYMFRYIHYYIYIYIYIYIALVSAHKEYDLGMLRFKINISNYIYKVNIDTSLKKKVHIYIRYEEPIASLISPK
jgi:hypothetical protein